MPPRTTHVRHARIATAMAAALLLALACMLLPRGADASARRLRGAELKRLAREHLSSRNASASRFTTSGTQTRVGTFEPHATRNATLRTRRAAIRRAVHHAWDGYVAYAWGFDELQPMSRAGADTFASGLGTTIVDSLSTLYLVGGRDDARFRAARAWVADALDLSRVGRVIVFESVIRILGGLLSVYHLSGDELFLRKAEELGVRLAGSFDTPHGLPWPKCFLNDTGRCEGHSTIGDAVYLAEVGSMQLEMRALAHHSHLPVIDVLRHTAEDILHYLPAARSRVGRLGAPHGELLPFALSRVSGMWSTSMVTMGAPADSYFEYLIKLWVQGSKREKTYWSRFAAVVDSMIEVVSYTTEGGVTIVRDVLVSADGSASGFQKKMDHFSCYIPGAIALALDGLEHNDTTRREKWTQFAEAIAESCYLMYARSPSGLAGEHIRLGNSDEWRISGGYQLRPEALEAFFYMWRLTKKDKYRRFAWEVFSAIERECRVETGGYAAVKSARTRRVKLENVMHSFVLAETFKYAYLTFGDDESEMSLDEWVFNTEGHPLLIMPGLELRDDAVHGGVDGGNGDGDGDSGGGGGGNERRRRDGRDSGDGVGGDGDDGSSDGDGDGRCAAPADSQRIDEREL